MVSESKRDILLKGYPNLDIQGYGTVNIHPERTITYNLEVFSSLLCRSRNNKRLCVHL
jgi:hypothetical protein